LAGLGLSNGGSSAILGNSSMKKKKGEKEERYAFCLFCIVFPTIIKHCFRISIADDTVTGSNIISPANDSSLPVNNGSAENYSLQANDSLQGSTSAGEG
jgi:hypothetical protein